MEDETAGATEGLVTLLAREWKLRVGCECWEEVRAGLVRRVGGIVSLFLFQSSKVDGRREDWGSSGDCVLALCMCTNTFDVKVDSMITGVVYEIWVR